MAKIQELHMNQGQEICNVAKALSSPIRLEILKLLCYDSMNIGEIAQQLQIPASSAALHIKVLEAANLINTEVQPGTRGTMKLCSRKSDVVYLYLAGDDRHVNEVVSVDMPVGAFSDFEVFSTCGMANLDGYIGAEDFKGSFYNPERFSAQILWTSGGYIEYKFPNPVKGGMEPKRIQLSLEICSEAPNYREDWKSNITVWMNDIDCGTWCSPGDFGARRGRLNPSSWASGITQYGLLTTWEAREDGNYVNGLKEGDNTVNLLNLMDYDYIKVRIGNKKEAKYVGGFNLFGEKFGDYPQNIVLSIEY